jgi:hypothetical protein
MSADFGGMSRGGCATYYKHTPIMIEGGKRRLHFGCFLVVAVAPAAGFRDSSGMMSRGVTFGWHGSCDTFQVSITWGDSHEEAYAVFSAEYRRLSGAISGYL